MPQLDFYILSTSVFWTLVKFALFYFLVLKSYAVSFISVMKSRQFLLCRYSKKPVIKYTYYYNGGLNTLI